MAVSPEEWSVSNFTTIDELLKNGSNGRPFSDTIQVHAVVGIHEAYVNQGCSIEQSDQKIMKLLELRVLHNRLQPVQCSHEEAFAIYEAVRLDKCGIAEAEYQIAHIVSLIPFKLDIASRVQAGQLDQDVADTVYWAVNTKRCSLAEAEVQISRLSAGKNMGLPGSTSATQFCTSCGAMHENTSKFCVHCGTKAPQVLPVLGPTGSVLPVLKPTCPVPQAYLATNNPQDPMHRVDGLTSDVSSAGMYQLTAAVDSLLKAGDKTTQAPAVIGNHKSRFCTKCGHNVDDITTTFCIACDQKPW